MNLVTISSFCWLWSLCIRSVFGDCHTGTADPQWLGIKTSTDETWSALEGTNSQASVYATIFTGTAWKRWRQLNNGDCTDFQKGSVDYFSDFKTVNAPWQAIALYSCSNNAWLIETVYFWDGSKNRPIASWDPAIFGPFPQNCVHCNGKPCTANDAFDIKLDNNFCPCAGAIFKTPTTGSKGTVWTGPRPLPPDCVGEIGAILPNPDGPEPAEPAPINVVNNSMNEFAERLLNYLMVTIGMAVILVISALCLVNRVVRNKGYVQAYDKVDI